jgi:ribosomal-protein-alanine N-acetyltransferase
VIRIRRDTVTRLPTRLEAGPPSRTAIRAVRPSDADDLLDLRLRNRDFLAPWDPLRPASFFTRAGQAEWIALQQRAWTDDRGYGFVVLDAEEGDRVVGGINLFNIVRSARQSAGMGYWIDQAAGSRGHATSAVLLAASFAFGHLGLHRLEPAVMPRNARSNRVMEKAGFRREGLAVRYLRIAGVWEDHSLYAMTAEDFAARGKGEVSGRQ